MKQSLDMSNYIQLVHNKSCVLESPLEA